MLTPNQCPFVFSYLLYGCKHLQNYPHNGKMFSQCRLQRLGPAVGGIKQRHGGVVQWPPPPFSGRNVATCCVVYGGE